VQEPTEYGIPEELSFAHEKERAWKRKLEDDWIRIRQVVRYNE
jgi:hypothetical protein